MKKETIYRRARGLLKFLSDPDNFAGLQVRSPDDRTRYKHKHKQYKRRGGSPPVDYLIVELKVDLEIAIREEDDAEVLSLYFQINRMLNPS